jgi:tungstate transport system substrate-binding protein
LEKKMTKKLFSLLSVLIVLSVLLAACATPTVAPTAAPVEPTAVIVEPTATLPEPTAVPVEPTPAVVEPTPFAETQKMILATTTSTQDSGLLDFILPDFEAKYNIQVEVIAVGSGQAMTLGKDGNADVLLVHSRAKEDEFMANGDGLRREDVMYNDFVIIGPAADPAGIKGMTSAADAFKKLADTQSVFISRGDDSGTHTKEKAIWKTAAIEPAGDWYISSGLTMGETLTMADEKQAYTLSDRATYLAFKAKGLELEVLVEGDKNLFNPYGVISVNPNKGVQIRNDLATLFIDWITSVPVQEKIFTFGVADYGQPLFTPSSTLWKNK